MPYTGNGNGCKSHGAVTEQGKLAIIRARTICGARTQAPTLPGESEQEFLDHLEGLRDSLGPANYHEEEIVRNVALAYWQLRRVSLYEVAKMRLQMEDAAQYHDEEAMGALISAGVEIGQSPDCRVSPSAGDDRAGANRGCRLSSERR
jgi:hypothetical protein